MNVMSKASWLILQWMLFGPLIQFTHAQSAQTHFSGTVESSRLSELSNENSNQVHPKIKGATVTAWKEGMIYHAVTSDVKGYFSLYLEGGAVYELIFSRKDYYNKKFIIDCTDAPRKNSNHPYQLDADISLFRIERGIADSTLEDMTYTSAKFFGGIIKFSETEAEKSRERFSQAYKASKSKK